MEDMMTEQQFLMPSRRFSAGLTGDGLNQAAKPERAASQPQRYESFHLRIHFAKTLVNYGCTRYSSDMARTPMGKTIAKTPAAKGKKPAAKPMTKAANRRTAC
jgi:hypothetical protein